MLTLDCPGYLGGWVQEETELCPGAFWAPQSKCLQVQFQGDPESLWLLPASKAPNSIFSIRGWASVAGAWPC